MSNSIIFHLVFLSQIIVLSYYYPSKILQRVNTMLTEYPPSKYPKLYNKSADYYALGSKLYKILNQIILLVGFAIIINFGYLEYSTSDKIEGGFLVFYFMLQMLPIFLMEIAGFSYFKQMRKANIQKTRKANFQKRSLFDFVSPYLVGLAIISNIGCILFIYYLDNFQMGLGSDAFIITITLITSNALFALIIRFNINGKKLDPYQDNIDRLRQISFTVKSLVVMSIVACFFLIMNQAMNYYNLDNLRVVFMSIYLQLIAWMSLGNMLRSIRIEDTNFDVYKNDISPT